MIRKRLTAAFEQTLHAYYLLSYKQKAIFLAAAAIALVALGLLVRELNRSITVLVPAHGGSYTEGILGVPRFINPLLALSDADRDLATLTYSGLMRIGQGGTPIPDLAESYTVSEDGLVYTFTLRENLVWHDGEAVTADDILFTIAKAQDPTTKSPKRASWEGVSAVAHTPREVSFTLKAPYGGFLENATLGILPKHIWESVDADSFPYHLANTEPVGTGPYQIEQISKDESGIPTRYELRAFRDFALGEPYIRTITVQFYPDQEALLLGAARGEIEAAAALPAKTARELEEKGERIIRSSSPLPRIFAVFFNQNQRPIFAQTAVREALSLAAGREELIAQALFGYGEPIYGPLPPGALGAPTSTPAAPEGDRFTAARKILENGGWELGTEGVYERTVKGSTNRLSFSVATVDTPELKSVAELVAADWRKLGAEVELNIFEIGDLNQSVIRPRKYDALFFGEIVGRDPDPFAFWESGERNDPGLNIALYANSKVDKLLKEARSETDRVKRAELYSEFEKIVRNDVPAAFLYSPYFVYLLPERVDGVTLGGIGTGSDRFLSVSSWYIEQDRVWTIFTDQNKTETQ